MPSSSPAPRRSDALANRERVVAAARDLLARSGDDVDALSLHLVAKAAGVGQGTMYRNFPTREHLAAEVYRRELDELVDAVPGLLAAHPPWDALTHWFDLLLEYARVKRGVMAALAAATWRDLYADRHHRLDDALTALLAAGRDAGLVRPGVDATDVVLLLGALSRVDAAEYDTRAPTVVAVILDGLRPPARPV
ncbi:TetR/AcrR family transcriptional regulator [Jatrophihabitans sp. YIM 134969]